MCSVQNIIFRIVGSETCDMIEGNESHIEYFQFWDFTPLSDKFKMLDFHANCIRIGYMVLELWATCQCWKQYKKKNWDSFFANISIAISATSNSFPLAMSHYIVCHLSTFFLSTGLNIWFESRAYFIKRKEMLPLFELLYAAIFCR